MKKNKILTQPTPVSELSFEELYDNISRDWTGKAQRLQVRRWRHLKQQLT